MVVVGGWGGIKQKQYNIDTTQMCLNYHGDYTAGYCSYKFSLNQD
jgi:hypothetical protein